MARPRKEKPDYCHHKPSDRAFVKIDGHRFYLGRFNSPESRDKYDMLIGEWKARGRTLPPPPARVRQADAITVSKTPPGKAVALCIEPYWEFAQTYYRHADGTPTDEVHCIRAALRILNKLYGELPGDQLDSLKVEAMQEHMISLGWSRKTINDQLSRIKRALKWMAKKKLIPAGVYHECATVEGLKAGRSKARETARKMPVPAELVDAIKPYVSTRVWSMVQLQLCCAARPGEIVKLKKGDINRDVQPWEYRPTAHKTAHHGHDRLICFGAEAQAILRPYLMRSDDAYLFSPAEAAAERRRLRHEQRKTPEGRGNNIGTNVMRNPKRRAGDKYTVDSYRRAVERACERAFPFPPAMQEPTPEQQQESPDLIKPDAVAERAKAREAWRERHHWHPHRLRHNAATAIRRKHGAEAAKLVLGVKNLNVAELYAERDEGVVRRIIGEAG
jgi:integrase